MSAVHTSGGVPQELWLPHFDNHVHARRRPMMDIILPEAAKRMCGGVFEPNTNPHLKTWRDVLNYLTQANNIARNRHWVGSIYLTRDTDPKEVLKAWEKGIIAHVKRYPPHGTTHSDDGVTPEMMLDKNSSTGKLLSTMAEAGIPLKNHGEVTHWNGEVVHPTKREGIYYQEVQPRIRDAYANLRQINAHVSTRVAVEEMLEFGNEDSYICEITPHHLMFDHNILYDGGMIITDHHCLPVVKDEDNWHALCELVEKRPKYLVAGSDMAAHSTKAKYAHRAFGGFYTYHCSLELYVQMLDTLGCIDYAEAFLYGNAKRFHKDLVPDNPELIHLTREPWKVTERVEFEDGEMTPFGFDEDPSKRFEFQWAVST